jgi:murein DD-endopeptidase MepM/ murein hydrolase activator NlpD
MPRRSVVCAEISTPSDTVPAQRKIVSMKAFFGVMAVAAALAAAPAAADHPVLTVLGETLSHDARAPAGDGPGDVRRLGEAMRAYIFRHYVAANGLTATAEEIAELADYNAEFRRRDRAQRARKLAQLEQRLGTDILSAKERAHLEDFRATLVRLAAYEAEQDRKPRPGAREPADDLAPWIEMWKVNDAIYERFGGTVARAPFGHYPHGAWAALIADYQRRGDLQFHDVELRERVLALFNGPPQIVVAPHEVDFTPYWRKPIPSSYFPDDAPRAERRDP